ncbi:hypothetical protein D3C81_2019280 [compost metagenome]
MSDFCGLHLSWLFLTKLHPNSHALDFTQQSLLKIKLPATKFFRHIHATNVTSRR